MKTSLAIALATLCLSGSVLASGTTPAIFTVVNDLPTAATVQLTTSSSIYLNGSNGHLQVTIPAKSLIEVNATTDYTNSYPSTTSLNFWYQPNSNDINTLTAMVLRNIGVSTQSFNLSNATPFQEAGFTDSFLTHVTDATHATITLEPSVWAKS